MDTTGIEVQSGHGSNPDSPIMKAIVFSRNFVPTYYLCLTVILVVATALHVSKQHGSRTLHKDTRLRHKAASIASSSSSSSLQGTLTSSIKDRIISERTSLLATSDRDPESCNGALARLRCHIESFLMYQPRQPLPALTSPSNQLPANVTTLVVLLVLAVNVFYLFYRNIPSLAKAQPFADRAGLCFVANLPVLYALGAKNNKPLKSLTGWSYEGLNIVHRRIGEWMVFLATCHAAGMLTLWYRVFRPLGYTFGWFLSLRIVVFGLTAFLAILIIYVTSTGYIRRRFYELFLASHIFLQLTVLTLLFFHHHVTRPYSVVAFAIWGSDRLISRLMITRKNFVGTLQIAADGETILLFCDVQLTGSSHDGVRSGWQAGQHVFVSIPALGWSHRCQSHPFTIASPAPPSLAQDVRWPLQLIIRSKDGFSQDLLRYAEFHQHTEVILDGPYGSGEIVSTLQRSDRTCLVAGGSGISVTYPLAWAIEDPDMSRRILSTRTIYQNGIKHVANIDIFPSRVDPNKHTHIWVRRSEDHGTWITMVPERRGVAEDPKLLAEKQRCKNATSIINKELISRNESGGRPDIRIELREWAQQTSPPHNAQLCVVVSGPDELARQVRNCASELVREGYNIDLFVEKFGW